MNQIVNFSHLTFSLIRFKVTFFLWLFVYLLSSRNKDLISMICSLGIH